MIPPKASDQLKDEKALNDCWEVYWYAHLEEVAAGSDVSHPSSLHFYKAWRYGAAHARQESEARINDLEDALVKLCLQAGMDLAKVKIKLAECEANLDELQGEANHQETLRMEVREKS